MIKFDRTDYFDRQIDKWIFKNNIVHIMSIEKITKRKTQKLRSNLVNL